MSHRIGAPARSSRADVARRVRDTLREEIVSGHYVDGFLPSEPALMIREGASRTAVRMALDLLRGEGLIKRQQGVGTFAVSHDQLSLSLDPPRSIMRLYERRSHLIDYVTISLGSSNASPGIAERLDVHPADRVVFMERLTLVNNRPVSLVSLWVSMSVGAPLLEGRVDLRRQGVLDIMEGDLGLQLGVTEYTIEATVADETVADLLDVSVGSPLLLRSTLNRLTDGRPASFGHARGRADRVRYECRGQRPVPRKR